MLQSRLKKVQQTLKNDNLDAFVICDPIHLFYLTGVFIGFGILVIRPKSAQLYIHQMTFGECQAIKHIQLLELSSSIQLINSKESKRVGFESSSVTVERLTYLKSHFKGHKLIRSSLISTMRQLKDAQEIKILSANAILHSKIFATLQKWIKVGVTEQEIANQFEYLLRKEGAQENAFDPIVAAGSGGSIPHYRPSSTRKIKKNEPILIDIGLRKDGYNTDMTRVISIGKMEPKVDKLYSIVQEAYESALQCAVVGEKLSTLDLAAREVLKFYGYEKEFIHGLGHGVGIETHELPYFRPLNNIKGKLEAGMVITIEPGIYLPNSMGVRYENMVYITESGPKVLG
ncbi:MAG: Xaa-Pro peptidase family protein [Rhabdochlamydiaceae bacterium]|nr:Xaa-Pro peptidase family protein [Candidatus Amphrikana amoebophyrae]